MTRPEESAGALSGLRVVELGTMIAAPMCGMLLADHGADVIKVEMPGTGDQVRQWGHVKGDVGLMWKVLGRNKRVVSLDLHEEAGREVLRDMLRTADVLIESFRPGTLEKWNLGPDTLTALNDRLIILRVSGWGQTGPYARRPGFGTLVEAFSGFAHINGWEDRPPTLPPFGLADAMAGFIAAFGVVAAWRARDRTGRGQIVDVPLYEPILTALGSMIIDYDQLGIVQSRTGNRAPFTAPRNAYQCKDDRWFVVSAGNQNTAHRLLTEVGGAALADDERFGTNRERVAHAGELDDVIAAWARTRTLDEALDALVVAEVPAAAVYTVEDLLADEHVRERGSIETVADSELGPVRVQAPIPRMSQTPPRIRFLGRPLGDTATDGVDPW